MFLCLFLWQELLSKALFLWSLYEHSLMRALTDLLAATIVMPGFAQVRVLYVIVMMLIVTAVMLTMHWLILVLIVSLIIDIQLCSLFDLCLLKYIHTYMHNYVLLKYRPGDEQVTLWAISGNTTRP